VILKIAGIGYKHRMVWKISVSDHIHTENMTKAIVIPDVNKVERSRAYAKSVITPIFPLSRVKHLQ
jgi:hypothetical protein